MQPSSQPRTLVLTERVPRIARLAPADVGFLAENHSTRLEIVPTGRRDRYRLTALRCIGVLAAPTCRLVIRPKIPLANVFAMLDPLAPVPVVTGAVAPEAGTEILDFLAGQLARRLGDRVAAGLHRGYRERREQGPVLHGRLDLPSQLREAAGRKERLHGLLDDFSADVACNRAVKATAEGLLASPLPGAEVRASLRRVLPGLEGVASVALTPQLWDEAEAGRLPEDYRRLLELCRLLADALAPGEAAGPGPSFLLDLERAFERHVTRGVADAFAADRDHAVSVQILHAVNRPTSDQPDLTMRPDLTLDRDGRPVLVVDAKWKLLPGNPETSDLYQVLAYGTALGAEAVALVYPGGRWRRREYHFTHSPLRLTVYTLRVRGPREGCLRSVRRLARALKAELRR